jgi:hypothetical protein
MNLDQLIYLSLGTALALVIGVAVYLRLPRKLKTARFVAQWKELQGHLTDKTSWPKALADADKMLNSALKARKFKGKSMGERMVSAQKVITNNDAMWFAHNLYKKVVAEPTIRLKEADVKTALIGYRNALKDIGALHMPPKPAEEPKVEVKS